MKVNFVELEVDGLKALVPSLKALPAVELMPLLAGGDSDPAARFGYTMELLAKNLPNELLDDFKALDLDDMLEVVTQWISKSMTEAEKNEGETK